MEEKSSLAANEDDLSPDNESGEEKEPYDPTGRSFYKKMCKQLRITPANIFLEKLGMAEMSLAHYGLGPKQAKAIASTLESNTALLNFDLSENNLQEDGCAVICEMMEDNCYITQLNLSRNAMGLVGSMAAERMIRSNNTLLKLICSGNKFTEHCTIPWAEAIKHTLYLKSLDLSHNEFGEAGGLILGPAIGENEAMEELSLRWNHIRLDGAIAIAYAMTSNQMLKSFDLAWNGFADIGAAAFGEALKVNSSLQELDLSNNRITEEGAKMLARGLAVNDCLQILRLGNNPLGRGGVSAILQAVKGNANSAMEEMHFDNIPVTLELLTLLGQMLNKNPNLKVKHAGLGGTEARAENEKQKEPMVLIRQYIDRANLRLVDFFNSIDKDKSMKVTRTELEIGLAKAKVAMTRDQISSLVTQLDKDGDGEIDYSEFVCGAQSAAALERESKKKKVADDKRRKEEKERRSQMFKHMKEAGDDGADGNPAN